MHEGWDDEFLCELGCLEAKPGESLRFFDGMNRKKKLSRRGTGTLREERLTGTVRPTRVGDSDVFGIGGSVGILRPTLGRGFPTCGKQKKKGASRDAPVTMAIKGE